MEPDLFIRELWDIIRERKRTRPPGSYVASLFEKGHVEILKKIGEEAFEVALGALGRNRKALISEIADLWFHLLVLMVAKGVDPDEIVLELRKRHGRRRRGSR